MFAKQPTTIRRTRSYTLLQKWQQRLQSLTIKPNHPTLSLQDTGSGRDTQTEMTQPTNNTHVFSPRVQRSTPPRPTLRTPPYHVHTTSPMRLAITGADDYDRTSLVKFVQKQMEPCGLLVQVVEFDDFARNIARDTFHVDLFHTNDYGDARTQQLVASIRTKMREIDPDVWVNRLLHHLRLTENTHWVVNGVRHLNELRALRRAGFLVVDASDGAYNRTSNSNNRTPPPVPSDTRVDLSNRLSRYLFLQMLRERWGLVLSNVVVT